MDKMTHRERIDAAITLQPVDRVPVIPLMSFFCARQAGITMEAFLADGDLARDVLEEIFDKLGGWDATALGSGFNEFTFALAAPAPMKIPGRELPVDEPYQINEQPIMTLEDYDFIVENGWMTFWNKIFPLIRPHIPPEEIPARLQAAGEQAVRDTLKWESKGVLTFMGGGTTSALSTLSYLRSMKDFTLDLFRHPDRVAPALERVMDELTASTIAGMAGMKSATQWGGRVVFLADPRAAMLSPKQFERFAWPNIKKFVLAHVEAGNTPMLHFDFNWGPFLEYFLELPRGKVILELDGMTDIFKAKEVLRDHMCLMGDVPANLLALGAPDEVSAYCRRLIDVVGKGSGFILSCGCEVPVNAKPENVRAMVDTGKNYYPHR